MVRLMEIVNKWCIRFFKVLFLNLLWTLFTLMGGFILGIGPSTYALTKLIHEWLDGDERLWIVKDYWFYFKEKFAENAILGIAYQVVGYILFIDIANATSWYLLFFTWIVVAAVLTSLLYLFPIMIKFPLLSLLEKVKKSLLMSFAYLQYTLVYLLVLLVGYAIIVYTNSVIVFVLGPTILMLIISYMINQVFKKIESQNEEIKKEGLVQHEKI